MSFSFFKPRPVTPDLSFIGVDMHSHLLPGIDDGLKTPEQTVEFVRELHTLGYKKLICTPHILSGVHNNTPETIGEALNIARAALAEAEIPVTLEAAAEYMIDDEFEKKLKANEKLLTIGNNYLLIEMSYIAPPLNLNEVLFELQMRGYKLILAHPERYNFYHGDFKQLENFRDRSILFQMNILSMSGYYGKEVKKACEKLIDSKMVEFIGTDMHHENHLKATKAFTASKEFYKLVKDIPLMNMSLL
jgi:tyrosine-protein phosphatase YwqE